MKFLLVSLFICVGSQHAACSSVTGYVYREEVGALLRLHTTPEAWVDAKARCQLEYGILASPTTSAAAQVMAAMMTDHGISLGFTGMNSRNNYMSLEGVDISDIPLKLAEESDNVAVIGEPCLALTGAGALADVSCASALPYLCRKEQLNSCGPKNNGYEWEPRTGSCYKFYRGGKTWQSALEVCNSEGGRLAVINSETEAAVLKDLFLENRKNKITGFSDVHAIIGFSKFDNGEWKTIYGDSLSEGGFGRWETGEPNNQTPPEDCGSLTLTGRLNDIPCTLRYAYICEITPGA